MSAHHTGSRDTTTNHKRYRLAITFPGRPTRYITDANKKVLRIARKRHVANGAEVELQIHEGFNVYRTTTVYQPEQIGEAVR